MYQNIADTEVSASAAASSIVSQIQAWGRGAIEPIHIIDAYNEVANNFAVGTNDLSQALEISAAGMATYGNTFEETIGLVTAGTEIMVGRSSQVARGLNTIAANIVKQKGLLAEYGIEVEDSNGNLKSTFDVLKELKPQWDKMTDAERNALGVALAGKNQYRVLASIMQNFGHAVDATSTALNSSGSAMEENAAYMESLEARTTNLKALFQQLSQSVVDSNLVKGILDIAAGLLQIANTDIGTIVTQFILLSGVLTGITGMIIKGFDIKKFGLGDALPYILAITAALVVVLGTIDLVKKHLEEKAKLKTFDGVNEKIQESEEKISEYDKKIKETSNKLKELNKIPFEERSSDINAEIARLEALITAYKTLAEQEKQRLATEGLESLRKTQYESGVTVTKNIYENGVVSADALEYLTQQPISDAVSKSYNTYEEAVYDVAKAVASVDESFAEFITEGHSTDEIAKQLDKRFIHIEKTTHDWNEELTQSFHDMRKYASSLNGAVKPSEELLKSTEDSLKANKDKYDALKAIESVNGNLYQQEKEFIETYESLAAQYTKATLGADNFKKAQEAIKGVNLISHYSEQAATLKDYVDALLGVEGIDTSNVGVMLDAFKKLGYLNLDYTEEELQNILDKINEVDEASADVDVNVDSEEAETTFDEILSSEEELESKGITIKSTSDANALLEAIGLIEEKVETLSQKSLNININGNISETLSDADSLVSAITSLPSNKNIFIKINTIGDSQLFNISSILNGLKDKTVNVKVNVSQNGSFPFKANGDDNFEGGPVLINDGEPVNGSSAELVVANNKAHIYNNGEPTVVNLPKGSKIFNAKDTQNILNSNKDLEFPAFQSGNTSYENDGYKDLFDKWLEGKKYLLALNLITEEKYYKDLEDMNEKYLSNIEEAQADYWGHQEEIYKWKTSQIDSQNDALKEQLELEKSLKGVIGAHSNKVLVYKNGTFQYISDIDAIDSAKRSFYKLNDEAKEKSQYSISLGGSGVKVTDNAILKNDYQEIKKMLQDVKYDDLNAVEWGKKESVKQENYTFSIDNLSLPNAKDAAGILSGLKNYAYQYSYG
jgi:TP901 family phage tail tape measure protein